MPLFARKPEYSVNVGDPDSHHQKLFRIINTVYKNVMKPGDVGSILPMIAEWSAYNDLNDGDSVQIIKYLKVKGSSPNLKQGKVFKIIRLKSKDDEIQCRERKSTLVLKTSFLKKV